MRPVSAKRRTQLADRRLTREAVIERDDDCRARGIAPGDCGSLPDRYTLEVHELTRGAGRRSAWLDPELCVALCPRHHQYVTDNPAAAKELGLAVSAHNTWRTNGS